VPAVQKMCMQCKDVHAVQKMCMQCKDVHAVQNTHAVRILQRQRPQPNRRNSGPKTVGNISSWKLRGGP
jgi:hypothetical protein